MMIERTAAGAVLLRKSYCGLLSFASTTRSTGHRATAFRQVLHHGKATQQTALRAPAMTSKPCGSCAGALRGGRDAAQARPGADGHVRVAADMLNEVLQICLG